MILKIMMIIFLALPTVYEISDDAEGDLDKKKDVIIRVLLWAVMSFIVHLTGVFNFFLAFNMALAWFFLFFDYAVTYFLIRNKVIEVPGANWFSYMGKSGVVDNLKFWRDLNPWVKLLIRLGYFALAITLIILL